VRIDAGPESYYWCGDGTSRTHTPPEPGALIAHEHAVWRVIEITELSREDWTEEDWTEAEVTERRDHGGPPMTIVVLRPVRITSTDVRARDHDMHYRWPRHIGWDVYPDEHYPVCSACGEPTPCREKIGQRVGAREMERMERYEVAGVCPACREPVTARQRFLTFPDNVELPGGPPVTFHRRKRCLYYAAQYETAWVAADPERRRATLSCPGHLVNHGNNTYDCTQLGDCSGPTARHPSYDVCDCPEHRPQALTCYPGPNARRNES